MADVSQAEYQCTVVSIAPFELREEKPGLVPTRFLIPASDGEEPQVLHIGKAIHYVYINEDRGSLQVRDSPDEVANSIVQDYINSQLKIDVNCHPGLFWVTGKLSATEIKLKHKDKLEAAKAAQRNWMVAICRVADDDWNKYHQHNVVSDFQRKAAEILGWEPEKHEWMRPIAETTTAKCPACGSLVPGNIVICPSCRCILKPEEHKKLTFA